MESLLTLAASHPSRTFAAGEILIGQGYQGGDLYILEQGQLAVERDGVRIATIATPGSLIGETPTAPPCRPKSRRRCGSSAMRGNI
jgi:CRP-like cAMP-binding protein